MWRNRGSKCVCACVIFRVSQQANNCSDCFAFFSSSSTERSAQKAHTMCHLQREERPAFVHCLKQRQSKSYSQFETTLLSDFWLTGRRGFFEANNVWWGRPDGKGKVAALERKRMISPQIRQFQGGDGQHGLDGLRAHISSTPSSRYRSIFMTSAL